MSRVLAAAALGVAAGWSVLSGPAMAQLGAPANSPAESYQGQQFVDLNGCLFLRAGYGARTLWVPMVDDGHRPICGMTPTGGAPAMLVDAAAPQVQPTLEVAAPPPPAPPPVAAAAAAAPVMPVPPKGWKLAWKDGRLNPLRGIGTARGQAMQDQVWTRTVPARLVTPEPPIEVAAAAEGAVTTRVSTMSAPSQADMGAARFVQIGSFGVPANAAGAESRIAALGLPWVSSPLTRGGKALQAVLAGPFATVAEAREALAILRASGFGDAILR